MEIADVAVIQSCGVNWIADRMMLLCEDGTRTISDSGINICNIPASKMTRIILTQVTFHARWFH